MISLSHVICTLSGVMFFHQVLENWYESDGRYKKKKIVPRVTVAVERLTAIMIKFCLLLCTLAIAVNGLTIERIIGGHDAPNHNYPHQVSFRERINGYRDLHFCSGAIINEKWILTAASCFRDRDTRNVVAVTGTNYLSEWGDGSYGIAFHVIPKAYANILNNNICLVRVKDEIKLSDIVQPIGLPDRDLPSGNLRAFFSGWGSTQNGGPLSNNLQEIDLGIIPNNQCRRTWSISNKHVCTLNGAGQGFCGGDVGGPLVITGRLVGIASYRNADCARGYPDVFTRVWSFIAWIQATMKKDKISS